MKVNLTVRDRMLTDDPYGREMFGHLSQPIPEASNHDL
jgi:hypothetical protein